MMLLASCVGCEARIAAHRIDKLSGLISIHAGREMTRGTERRLPFWTL